MLVGVGTGVTVGRAVAFGGQDTQRHQDLVSALSFYWYAGVAVYSIIWIGIYIAK